MSDGIEYAARREGRGESPFPEHWHKRGLPAGDDWVIRNIEEDRRLGIPSSGNRSFVDECGRRWGRKSGAELLREHLATPRGPHARPK